MGRQDEMLRRAFEAHLGAASPGPTQLGPEPVMAEVLKALHALRDTADGLQSRLSVMADRALGPVPTQASGPVSNAPVPNPSVAEELQMALASLSRRLDAAHDEVTRLQGFV